MVETEGIPLLTRFEVKFKMKLRIYDTFKRAKVDFTPNNSSHVKIYVCGPTVYDFAHIGNARPVIIFDVLVRLLRHLYPKVTYVRNITDIDDKINARSLETGESINLITDRTTRAFEEDMSALNSQKPDYEPRATDHVEEMKGLIKILIEKKHAYEINKHVLFSVSSMAEYGQLSRLNKRELLAGARIDVAPFKQDPQDFVLWKPSDQKTPGWDSPWGRGRPGWHIECSAMSQKYLGDAFDIHGGGQDLIFPHHENEIAQSKCALGSSAFAKYWMHNGYLMTEGSKMSKSLGNFYTVRDLLKDFPGEAIRFLLLKTHYRQPLDFTKRGLREAKTELDRLYRVLQNFNTPSLSLQEVKPPFDDALLDDLNSPLAITKLHKISSQLNKGMSDKKKNVLICQLLSYGKVLGLLQSDPQEWFQWQPNSQKSQELDKNTIERMILARTKARETKNFNESDKIRDQLLVAGIILEDNKKGTSWRRQ